LDTIFHYLNKPWHSWRLGVKNLLFNWGSSSAQCLQYVDLIFIGQPGIESPYLFAVDEDLHMRADGILFIDHPEANSGVAAIEILEHFSDRRTSCFDIFILARV